MNWKVFAAHLAYLLVVDFVWLGLIASSLYTSRMTEVGRFDADGKLQVIYWAGAAVYVMLAVALTVFVMPKAAGDGASALLYGALFGFSVYGIYDLTNHATLKEWPLSLMAIDMAWGTFLCASSAWVVNHFSEKLT